MYYSRRRNISIFATHLLVCTAFHCHPFAPFHGIERAGKLTATFSSCFGRGWAPIDDISILIERYSLMAAILATRFPDKARELFTYQATIVQADRNYEGKRWVKHDCLFRREEFSHKDLNWSVTNSRCYKETFTGRAWAIPTSSYCG
jgi:hypothetical protein